MLYLRSDGYRIAMVGTIALYDKAGARLERKIEATKKNYPKALYVGVADGAQDNWTFLNRHTSIQITDFWHVAEYLAAASEVMFSKRQELERQEWLETRCHKLKHRRGAASRILTELEGFNQDKLSSEKREKLNKTISYFRNQKVRMKYSAQLKDNLPIGSGVTEAACKTIIKQRLCKSGMKWKEREASVVLSLRCLDRSNRWAQFWDKLNQYGTAFA